VNYDLNGLFIAPFQRNSPRTYQEHLKTQQKMAWLLQDVFNTDFDKLYIAYCDCIYIYFYSWYSVCSFV